MTAVFCRPEDLRRRFALDRWSMMLNFGKAAASRRTPKWAGRPWRLGRFVVRFGVGSARFALVLVGI